MTVYRHSVSGAGAAGDVWICTLHTSSANFIDVVHDQFVSSMDAFLNAHLKALWNTHTASELATTVQLDPSGFSVAKRQSPLAVTGTGAGQSLAQGTCLLVSWTSAVPRRKGRGRMYLPAPDASHMQANGLYVVADCQNVADDALALLADLRTSTSPILHPRDGSVDVDITGAKVNSKPAFQRRRINKVADDYSVGT